MITTCQDTIEIEMAPEQTPSIEIALNAVIVSVVDSTPYVLTLPDLKGRPTMDSLPSGPFNPLRHRTFEIGLREFVHAQTALPLGYVEQLYTFGDRGRYTKKEADEPHVISVGYLALTRQTPESQQMLDQLGAKWRPWYSFFPWEDWREGKPEILQNHIDPLLNQLCRDTKTSNTGVSGFKLKDRYQLSFGAGALDWDEERVLDRYELMYALGVVPESLRDGRTSLSSQDHVRFGCGLQFDHRRILATALSRLRAKLKYRPVIFELMPDEFTLTDLQRTVEAISGHHLHKQNFRRLVEVGQLVEPTGGTSTATGGRPAALYRFRRDILKERPAPGLRVSRN
ncbi:NUDIX hydrolase [Polycladidibacter stylochi]|uniref:NUDIX hydrolase n=1 Tax=Polycladidibacter stylochi TaxID=1807766 RepID=UPI000AD4D445|nr:NAD regulator [Pseudovibrio stylochi]